ncbi:uncharacterized protein FSUBG_13729 [Fusarium subglutinans]|uniref:Uncharacterized protein n=1 Tax=Gibberella subglutinans TaxID=42677 RepID=A0A8H5KU68_GIBSU|nr:uncharacterized protein FSUBG_13729 [Fusarium subglutinans]KAF5578711.1 hypothetical protein FSUBG_13729 [Fusarium subglutinans]
MYRYIITALLGVVAMAYDTSTSTPYTSNQDRGTALPDTHISSPKGLSERLSIRRICNLHKGITDIQTARPSKPTTCLSLLDLDENRFPWNETDKLCVPTTREFGIAKAVIMLAWDVTSEKLDDKTNKEWWQLAKTCASILQDPSDRNVYLREFLPKIESDGIDGWEKICIENSWPIPVKS